MDSNADDLLLKEEIFGFLRTANVGFWQSNLEKNTVRLISSKLLGFNSGMLTFHEFKSHISDENPDDQISAIFNPHVDLIYQSKIAHFTIDGKSVPVSFSIFRDCENANQERELWGSFKLVKSGSDERYENDSFNSRDILIKQNKISQAMLNFVNGQNLEQNVNRVLKDVIEQYDVDRVYVFEYSHNDKLLSCAYEIVGPDISAEKDNLQDIPIDQIPWWDNMVKSESPIVISSLDDLPNDASIEYEMLAKQGIKSLLVMPIYSKKQISGFFGIDMVRRHVMWSSEDLNWFSTIVNLFSVVFALNKSEMESIKAKEKALEMERLKSSFLANISHEIRTPLNTIVGFSNMLAEDGNGVFSITKEEKAAYSSIINKNSSLLLQLINDILDVSRIEAGIVDIKYSLIDLRKIFEEVVQEFASKIREGVELRIEIPDTEIDFICDKNRLLQLLSNFVSNAVKFTFTGTITLGYNVCNDGVKFYVTDTGIGIAKDKQSLIFENFIKLNSYVQGTGLGLAICRNIVTHLNGEIGVESELGSGSTFWFKLPNNKGKKYLAEPIEHVDRPKKDGKSGGAPLYENPLVLVAEDDESSFLLVSSMLKNKYRIEWAHNGLEAVESFKKINPEIILMDVKMPIMDGIEATRIIRTLSQTVPIIAVTSFAYDTDKVKAFEAGCSDFLFKPIRISELNRLIVSLLK